MVVEFCAASVLFIPFSFEYEDIQSTTVHVDTIALALASSILGLSPLIHTTPEPQPMLKLSSTVPYSIFCSTILFPVGSPSRSPSRVAFGMHPGYQCEFVKKRTTTLFSPLAPDYL